MNKIIIILISIFFNGKIFAQDWGRYWCFGDSAAIDFSDLSNPTPLISYMDNAWPCTSVGDSSNGLLLYAHSYYLPIYMTGSKATTAIHNKNHNVILNGDSLIGRMHEGLTFITKPNSDNFVLIQTEFSTTPGIFYSVVDPHFGQDTGKVIMKNIPLPLSDNMIQTGIIAIRHGNGRDWWVICRNYINSNKFNLYLFTPDSIVGPIEQNIGSITPAGLAGISVSKQGDKICIANVVGLIELYDFDRCSGYITSPVSINTSNQFKKYIGCEFSPNGSLLYISVTDNIVGDSLSLYQFDITNSNPGNTIQKIYQENVPASGGFLKRGPDDKIYLACTHVSGWSYTDTTRNMYNENLSVINNPDVYGLGCNFAPFSFYLGGKRTYWNLPNNPNFLLGPLLGSACDSLSTSISHAEIKQTISLFPNPASEKLNVIGNLALHSKYKIYNSEGDLINEGLIDNLFLQLDVSKFTNGLYIISINNSLFRKFIVIH